ncbi:MAG TPA: cytochrome c3 family protein [Desulfosarcina sp.]|nr:cytochrome c3 family protein [Desulfosarcina sp.]
MKRSCLAGIVILAALGVFTAVLVGAAAQGPEKIVIEGGVSGKVPFPHARHQDRIGDCNVCHGVFPQEAEAIRKLKEQGKLKPKKVMNLQCIKCHKQEKQAGKPHGPLTCTQCHVK